MNVITQARGLLMLLLLLLQTAALPPAQAVGSLPCSETACNGDYRTPDRRDSLRDSGHHPWHYGEAILADGRMPLRLLPVRPSRLLPSTASNQGRQMAFLATIHSSFIRCHNVDAWRRTPSAPLRRPASCDYYVIALRHILR